MYPAHARCSTWSSSTARRAASSRATWSPARSSRTPATRWCSRTGGYGNVFYLSTNAKGCNVTATWRAYKRGACFANPCFTQIHPTCIPVTGDYQSKLTLMSRVAAQRRPRLGAEEAGRHAPAGPDPRSRARLLPRAQVPELRQPGAARRRLARAKEVCDEGRGVGATADSASTSTSRDAIKRAGRRRRSRETYGNLFDMYEQITGENPYQVPMRIYPAVHYTMGGLWVDYNLMSNDPRPVRARRGELLRPRRQPPRRQRADAGPGRRLLRPAVHDRRLPGVAPSSSQVDDRPPGVHARPRPRSSERTERLLGINGKRTVDSVPPRAGQAHVGQLRHGAQRRRPRSRRSNEIPELREEFWSERAACPASGDELNQSLEKAGRVADFLEFGELMCLDALHRERVLRRPLPRGVPDARRRSAARRRALLLRRRLGVSRATGKRPMLHKEPLSSRTCSSPQRSYK